MGAKVYFDREGFLNLQKEVKAAGDEMTTLLARARDDSTVFYNSRGGVTPVSPVYYGGNRNRSGNIDQYLQKYDKDGSYLRALEHLKQLKGRITTLDEQMEKTLKLWEEAAKRTDSKVANIRDLRTIYGVTGFGAAWASGAERNYTTSRAWQNAYNSEHPFPDSYNEWSVWENSPEFKNAMKYKEVSEIANADLWYQWASGDCTPYVELLLEESMLGMMKTLPGYEGMDASTPSLNWDALGEQLGIPNIGNKIALLNKIIGKGNVNNEYLDAWLKMMKKDLKEYPEAFKFLEQYARGADAVCEGISKGLGAVKTMQEYTNLVTEMVFHMLSNHEMQIRYLDTLQDAMIQQGFSHGLVAKKIEDLKLWYEDEEAYAWNEACKFVNGKIAGKSAEMWDFIPGLKGARKVTGWVSSTAKAIDGNAIGAANKLMGYKQFDGVLTKTYEKYLVLMQEGIASSEDVAKADQIFELLRATKIAEYKAMMSLYDVNDLRYTEMAVKVDELQKMAEGYKILNK